MQDCPPPLVVCDTERDYDGYWTDSIVICDRENHQLVSNYRDNRMNIGYLYETTGVVTIENTSDVARVVKSHYEVPMVLVPYWLPLDQINGDLCLEDDGTIVWDYQIVLDPGEIVTYEWDASITWADPFNGADFNGDYAVDSQDLALLLAAYGPVDFNNIIYDLNGDNVVDSIDLGLLLAEWTDTGN